MTNWYNCQNEGLTDGLTTISQLERMYDYANENDLEFMDDDYLFGNCGEEEQRIVHKFKRELREEFKSE